MSQISWSDIGGQFIDAISKDTPYEKMEEDLTCPVCLELYADPLMMPCSHSMCKGCLHDIMKSREKLGKQDLECPACRETHHLTKQQVNKLPKNLALENIVFRYQEIRSSSLSRAAQLASPSFPLSPEPQQSQTPSDISQFHDDSLRENDSVFDESGEERYVCGLCEGTDRSDAVWYCPKCQVLYCQACLDTFHPRRGSLGKHKLLQPAASQLPPQALCCEDHSTEVASIFCDTCKVIACHLCVCIGHGSHCTHTILDLDTAHNQLQKTIQGAQDKLSELISTFSQREAAIGTYLQNLKDLDDCAQRSINSQYNCFLADLISTLNTSREKSLNSVSTISQKQSSLLETRGQHVKALLSRCETLSEACKGFLSQNDRNRHETDTSFSNEERDGAMPEATISGDAPDVLSNSAGDSSFVKRKSLGRSSRVLKVNTARGSCNVSKDLRSTSHSTCDSHTGVNAAEKVRHGSMLERGRIVTYKHSSGDSGPISQASRDSPLNGYSASKDNSSLPASTADENEEILVRSTPEASDGGACTSGRSTSSADTQTRPGVRVRSFGCTSSQSSEMSNTPLMQRLSSGGSDSPFDTSFSSQTESHDVSLAKKQATDKKNSERRLSGFHNEEDKLGQRLAKDVYGQRRRVSTESREQSSVAYVKGITQSSNKLLLQACEVGPILEQVSALSNQVDNEQFDDESNNEIIGKDHHQKMSACVSEFKTSSLRLFHNMTAQIYDDYPAIVPSVRSLSASSPHPESHISRVQSRVLMTWGFNSTTFTADPVMSGIQWTVNINRNTSHIGDVKSGYLFGVGVSFKPSTSKEQVGMCPDSHGVVCVNGMLALCSNKQISTIMPLSDLPIAITISVGQSSEEDDLYMCYKILANNLTRSLRGKRVLALRSDCMGKVMKSGKVDKMKDTNNLVSHNSSFAERERNLENEATKLVTDSSNVKNVDNIKNTAALNVFGEIELELGLADCADNVETETFYSIESTSSLHADGRQVAGDKEIEVNMKNVGNGSLGNIEGAGNTTRLSKFIFHPVFTVSQRVKMQFPQTSEV